MPVELSPADELDIHPALLGFADENYCANCTHFRTGDDGPYCRLREDRTRVEPGMVCPDYLPQGYK